MADAVPGMFAPHAPTAYLLLARWLADKDESVRLASLDAYATCTNALSVCAQGDEPRKVAGDLVPAVSKVAHNAASTVLALDNGSMGSTACSTDEDDLSGVL